MIRLNDIIDLLARYAPIRLVEGCEPLLAHQAADVFALWRAWEERTRRHQEVPFWAIVWPAARVLARWVLDNEAAVRGARVLELGCGGGVVAIAAACAGAPCVVANDIDKAALFVATRNAAANGATIEACAHDLLVRPASSRPADRFNVVFVADLFYEKEQAARTTRFLRDARCCGTRVIVADAGRPFAPGTGFSVLRRERIAVNRDAEGVDDREVTVFEMA